MNTGNFWYDLGYNLHIGRAAAITYIFFRDHGAGILAFVAFAALFGAIIWTVNLFNYGP